MDIVDAWIAILGLAIFFYVILDGFGLGIGLLFPFMRTEEERDQLIEAFAPVWDANQTWLVFGGGGLFVAFPLIYGVMFTALYIPLFSLIYGLIFRGVSLEFRANAVKKRAWDRAFFLGSLTAVAAQGVILGGILSGIRVTGNDFSGGALDWLTPFSLVSSIGVVAGYILLGSAYLIIKTTGSIQDRSYHNAFRAAVVALALQVAMVIWTPFNYPQTVHNWLSAPRIYFIWIFPVLSLISFIRIVGTLRKRREFMPFVWSVIFFFSGYIGLFASIYPHALPPYITFHAAAAERETLWFTFWGAVFILPVVLAYTIYSYTVFRGKVTGEGYYHG